MVLSDIDKVWSRLNDREKKELEALIIQFDTGWVPQEGTQTLAYNSKASVIGFGGAAGGGKTALLCGLTLAPWHKRIQIARLELEQTKSIRQEIIEILLKRRNQKNISPNITGDIYINEKTVSFVGLKDERAQSKVQGNAFDFKAFDEVTAIPEKFVKWSLGWNRSADPTVKVQTLMTFNPPLNRDSAWVLDYFEPWIDRGVPSGTILYSAVGKDREEIFLERKDPFVWHKGEILYDFDPDDFEPSQIIKPISRTFIKSMLQDNKYLAGTTYESRMQSIQDAGLYKALYLGDMRAMLQDGSYQLFKTNWILEAFDRYDAIQNKENLKMVQIGVDVARGGADKTALCPRYENNVFGEIITYQGKETATGLQVADLTLKHRKDNAIICIDTIGIGSSPFDMLTQHYNFKSYQDVIPVTVSKSSNAMYESFIKIRNLRDELHFNLAHMLKPDNNMNIAIKRDKDLLREMEAVERFVDDSKVASVSSRSDMVEKIGRSPDKLSALLMSAMKVYDLRNYSISRINNPLDLYRR
jgi:hypothetical protein